tara:strand:+ start:4027 stop:4365 length:339 start_codon:yes stop_codon:yes gene_type:complete
MEIIYKNKKIKIPIKKVSGFEKIKGLMFKSKTTENLLFKFKKNSSIRIHSFFVFFDFLCLWLNNKNEVIEREIVKPFTLSIKPKKSFYKLVEIPVNKKNKKIIHFFVGKRKI